MGVTSYSGITKFYFRYLLKQIIKVGFLEMPGICILDFGCGEGELKRMLPGRSVIGYDVVDHLSEVSSWQNIDFDVLVANEVFYCFAEKDLILLLEQLKKKNSSLKLVVGISNQGLFNNIGKHILGRPDAHSATKISPVKEIEILERYLKVVRKKNVLNLATVYVLEFK